MCCRSWLKEMLSLLRGEAQVVAGTDLDQLIKKHKEYRVQIDRQLSKCQAAKEEGRRLVQEADVKSNEVRASGQRDKSTDSVSLKVLHLR